MGSYCIFFKDLPFHSIVCLFIRVDLCSDSFFTAMYYTYPIV